MKISAVEKKLFKKNKAFFLRSIPGLVEMFEKNIPSNIELMGNADEIDVIINGSRFYGIDARAYAQKHIELFLKAPSAAEMSLPYPDKERTPTHVTIFENLEKRFNTYKLAAGEQPTRIGAGTSYIFGLGLGFHVEDFVKETLCRSLVIIEPEPVFLVLSLYFVDWKNLFKKLDNRVAFIVESTPEYAFNAIRRYVSAMNVGVQQLIYHTQHYKTPILDAIYENFKKDIPNLFDGLGFYDDEKVMTRNHLLNSYEDDWKLLINLKNHHSGSAVVVGAGPSLDENIDWLRKNKESVFVFSGGSALPTLLANGITPDFHVEIENVAMNFDLLSPLVEKYDLSKTILICSSTMDTRAARLFQRRLWFMREGVFASTFFNPEIDTISWQNPTVVNTAMSAALASGFRDVLLLGADFGTRNREVHHSTGSFYDIHEELKRAEFKFPDITNANFGGVAYTNEHYLNGVRYLQILMREYRDSRVFNASNGVLIKGITPIKADRYKIKPILSDKNDLKNGVYDLMPVHSWKNFHEGNMIDYLEKHFIEYMESMKKISRTNTRKTEDTIRYFMEIFAKMSSLTEGKGKFNPIFNGTVINFTVFCIYWWRRVYMTDFDSYQKFVKKEFGEMIRFLEKDFIHFLNTVRQELPLVRPDLFVNKVDVSRKKV